MGKKEVSFKTKLENLDKEYPIKTKEYWVKFRVINDEVNERLSNIDPSIFPDATELFKNKNHENV